MKRSMALSRKAPMVEEDARQSKVKGVVRLDSDSKGEWEVKDTMGDRGKTPTDRRLPGSSLPKGPWDLGAFSPPEGWRFLSGSQ